MARAGRNVIPIFRSAFESPEDEYDVNKGTRPVVFDILAPDMETSILPENLKMVLHVNPVSMTFSYSKLVERIQTKGGYVEQHWGDAPATISFSMVTGGFMRLFSGLSNVTGGGWETYGTRRETIAYDKFLDMLALFHHNGSVYDVRGQIVFQGAIKVTFDGGIYIGWFSSFNVDEAAEKPYQFTLSAEFSIKHEIARFRSFLTPEPNFVQPGMTPPSLALPTAPEQPEPEAAKAPPVAKSVPQEENPDKPLDPTLPGEDAPVVLWSGATGEIDPGLRPYRPEDYPETTPPPVASDDPSVVPWSGASGEVDPGLVPYWKTSSPGWEQSSTGMDLDGSGILDEFDPKTDDAAGGILDKIEAEGDKAGAEEIDINPNTVVAGTGFEVA